MKLTSTQIERTLGQFEAQAIPEDHPVAPQINELFGEHTFFLNSNGLNILEPAEGSRAGVQSAKVVKLADRSGIASSALGRPCIRRLLVRGCDSGVGRVRPTRSLGCNELEGATVAC
jgi:hypothetical protein